MIEVLITFILGCILFYILYKKMFKLKEKSEIISWYILGGICILGCFYSNIKGTGMIHYGMICLSILASDMIFSFKEEQKSFVTKVISFILVAFFMFMFSMFMQMN